MLLCSAHTVRHRARRCARFAVPHACRTPLARRPNSLSTNVNPPCCEPCPRRAPLVPTVPPAPATAAHSPQGSHATPEPAVHHPQVSHAMPEPACLPAEVLKPQTSISLQSISNFMFSLPNSSKGCEGATVPAQTALALRNWHSISNFIVSLPNVSEKDVKGLLFRKQPRTVEFRLYEIGKAFQTLSSAYRTQVKRT